MGHGNGSGTADRQSGRPWRQDGAREGAPGRPLGAASASRARGYRAGPDPDIEVWDAEIVDEPWDPAVARSAEDVEIIDAAKLDAIAQRLRAAAGPVADEPVAGRPPQPGTDHPTPHPTPPAAATGPVPRPAAATVRRRHRPRPAWRTGLERLTAQVTVMAAPSRLGRVLPAHGTHGRRIGRAPLAAVAGAVVLLLVVAALAIVLFGHHSGSRTGATEGRGSAGQTGGVNLAPGGLALADGPGSLAGDGAGAGAGGSGPVGGQGAEQVSGVQAEPVQGLGVGATPDLATTPTPDVARTTAGSTAGASARPSSGASAAPPSSPGATPTAPRCYRGGPITTLLLAVVGVRPC
ncbi:hypothetical protein I6A60_11230 [Frankia sp. AgB1.9]|uniref:hypothetical protein n=1 Tax=unclassified Frankia TaxID=2632575 RepID=UPI0019312B7A|nr:MULTISPECIES: hypothetical protein [unclassified Frankia]MBL7489706.1 hypothetical protein [Frankia sp. AgW1.1]MBL7548442.1 hypothetical protein [Frankia sp. AgB1.9]MBL7621332.1 hypothetical protein [Frankia sp. AgB1.8]